MIKHPYYMQNELNWELYRLAYAGGQIFIDRYLERFSTREDDDDFKGRKKVTYCPAHSKAAIKEIINSIFANMGDIVRAGGSKSYQQAVKGEGFGVDMQQRSMNNFIASKILPELLVMQRVGVYVDRGILEKTKSILDERNNPPYLHVVVAEDIMSWSYDARGQLEKLLIRGCEDTTEEKYGLPSGKGKEYTLFFELTSIGVLVTKNEDEPKLLDLPKIPFALFEISESLMTDVAMYQVALLNLASSDMHYAIKSNFPFYVEQISPFSGSEHLKNDNGDNTKDVKVGATHGRAYGKGLERPGFINPSSEPLEASMAKQQQLKEEIRNLVQLSVASLKPVRASAESKTKDQDGLNAGLACIGDELEHGERIIAQIWALYEATDPAIVAYPVDYTTKTEEDRRKRADDLIELRKSVTSLTYQKEISKEIANVTIGHRIDSVTLSKIHSEIQNSKIVAADPDIIRADVEAGILDRETAADARLYPEGVVAKAKAEHLERLEAIAKAQSEAPISGARGTDDHDDDSGKLEKEGSRNTDLKDSTKPPVRGKGKTDG